MTIDELKTHKRICIVGYGLEGKSTEKFIKKYHPKASIIITDAHDGPDYLDRQHEADLVIKTPGLPKEYITIPYTTATNLFFGNIKNKVIGITGTKGKSTTTALLHHTLETAGVKTRICGNIGIPMITLLTEGTLDPEEILCIELSSYQLDDISYSPHIGVVLNISPEHLDYHGNLDAYLFAKQRIAAYMTDQDYYIYNPAFPELGKLKIDTKAKILPFRSSFVLSDEEFMDTEKFHRDDLAAVETILDLFDIPLHTFKRALQSFKPLPHRLELVGTYQDIRFINDSASSNPVSAIFALQRIRDVDTIILGGLDRGYDTTELVEAVEMSGVRNVILFPEFGNRLKEDFTSRKIRKTLVSSMQEAVEAAYGTTKKGKTCLLSPGAPSYNMFTGFPDRGDQFKSWVEKLGK